MQYHPLQCTMSLFRHQYLVRGDLGQGQEPARGERGLLVSTEARSNTLYLSSFGKVRLLIRHPRYYHLIKQKRSKQLAVGLVIKARSNCICRLERYLPFRWSSFCFARQDQLRYLSGLGRTTLGKRIEFEPLYLPMEKEGQFYMESSLFVTA